MYFKGPREIPYIFNCLYIERHYKLFVYIIALTFN